MILHELDSSNHYMFFERVPRIGYSESAIAATALAAYIELAERPAVPAEMNEKQLLFFAGEVRSAQSFTNLDVDSFLSAYEPEPIDYDKPRPIVVDQDKLRLTAAALLLFVENTQAVTHAMPITDLTSRLVRKTEGIVAADLVEQIIDEAKLTREEIALKNSHRIATGFQPNIDI